MIFDTIKHFGQLYIIFGLAICLFVSHSQTHLYKAKLATAQIQLSTYQIEGNRLAQRIESAQKEAVQIKQDYDKQIQAVLSAKVPAQCESAIEWGVSQASLF